MANACTNVKKRRTRAGLSFQLYTFFTWTNFRTHFRKSHLKSLKLKTLGKGFVSRCTRSLKKTKNICNYRLYSSRFSSLESFFFSAIVLRRHRANTASDDIIVYNPSQWVFSANPFRTKLKISYCDHRSAWLG